MNNKGNASLTMMIIGVIVFIGVMSLIYSTDFGIYNKLMEANGKTIDAQYASALANLSSQQDEITGLSDAMSEPTNLWQWVKDLGSAGVNTLAVGLSVISMLGSIPGYIIYISNILQSTTGLPQPIFWMLTTIVSIYGIIKLVQALRGTSVET